MEDSIQLLRDSITFLNQANINKTVPTENINHFNIIVGVISIIGVIATLFSLYQWYKTKKSQEVIFKQAKIVLEKESTQEELTLKKKELTNIENQLTQLQRQIQKNLPLTAREAVLKDRLEESLEHLHKYYEDVVSTKAKLERVEGSKELEGIPAELMKNIQDLIEPRFVIKEKISTSKTYLTVVSVLSSIMFVAIPYPIGNYAGIIMILIGLPFVINIVRLTLIKKASDRLRTKRVFTFIINIVAIILSFAMAVLFWMLYLFNNEIGTLLSAILFLGITIILIIYNFRAKHSKKTEQDKE